MQHAAPRLLHAPREHRAKGELRHNPQHPSKGSGYRYRMSVTRLRPDAPGRLSFMIFPMLQSSGTISRKRSKVSPPCRPYWTVLCYSQPRVRVATVLATRERRFLKVRRQSVCQAPASKAQWLEFEAVPHLSTGRNSAGRRSLLRYRRASQEGHPVCLPADL
jgi:hypothetical protein